MVGLDVGFSTIAVLFSCSMLITSNFALGGSGCCAVTCCYHLLMPVSAIIIRLVCVVPLIPLGSTSVVGY